jgi:hypothetical protein
MRRIWLALLLPMACASAPPRPVGVEWTPPSGCGGLSGHALTVIERDNAQAVLGCAPPVDWSRDRLVQVETDVTNASVDVRVVQQPEKVVVQLRIRGYCGGVAGLQHVVRWVRIPAGHAPVEVEQIDLPPEGRACNAQ